MCSYNQMVCLFVHNIDLHIIIIFLLFPFVEKVYSGYDYMQWTVELQLVFSHVLILILLFLTRMLFRNCFLSTNAALHLDW